ncbi:MAG: hypothetical protein QXR84_05700 [Candidatus Bathyarchaeia archaeon]|nr:hypothetical protein [Candidatus Bathyarchaeota archaeon]
MHSSRVLPRRLSFPKICEVLIAYLNAGADKEYISVSEVAEKTTVTLHNISRNNGFFKSWGFIEESEKEQGKYRLTKEAAEFAHAYRIDPDGDLTRAILRNILSKDEVLVKFVERIRSEGIDRETALIEVPRLIGDLRADKVGLNAFLDLIAYAFQIDWISTPIKRPTKPPKKPVPSEARVVKLPVKKKVERGMLPAVGVSMEPRTNITINLTITSEITPAMLKEYIKALLEAYNEYAQENIPENED